MKYFNMVPALVLVLVFALAVSASAGILRGEDLNNPGSIGGGGEEDGDHPWGGDQSTGGGTVSSRPYRLTALSGYPALDLLISEFLNYFSASRNSTQQNTGVQSTVQSSDALVTNRPSAATVSSRFRSHKEAK